MGYPAPYITEQEVLNWSLPVSWSRVGPTNPTPNQNAGQIAQMCDIATSIVNGECGQLLRATVDVETLQGPGHRVGIINSTGLARVMTSMAPILKVVQVRIATGPPQQTSSGQPFAFQWITVPAGLSFPEQQPFGPYQSSGPGGATAGQNAIMVAGGYVSWQFGRMNQRIELTYVNGWPHTTLAAPVIAGATTLSVDDVTGWYNSSLGLGAIGTVSDLPYTENIRVIGVSAVGQVNGEPAGAGTLTIAAPGFVNPHPAGVIVTGMPHSIRDAAALFTAAQAVRAGLATVTAPTVPGAAGGGGGVESMVAFLEHSATLQLNAYRRIIGT